MPLVPQATGIHRGHLVEEPGNGKMELFPLNLTPPEHGQAQLERLLREIFSVHWDKVDFGILIQGAVFEVKAPHAPTRIGMLDGYLTIEFSSWHFHVCIGEHHGTPGNLVSPELARHRRTGRAELYRRLDSAGRPVNWGLRLLNGQDEQQLTIFLPNPLLDDQGHQQSPPDWDRLDLWDALRLEYLNLKPEALDREADRFVHD